MSKETQVAATEMTDDPKVAMEAVYAAWRRENDPDAAHTEGYEGEHTHLRDYLGGAYPALCREYGTDVPMTRIVADALTLDALPILRGVADVVSYRNRTRTRTR